MYNTHNFLQSLPCAVYNCAYYFSTTDTPQMMAITGSVAEFRMPDTSRSPLNYIYSINLIKFITLKVKATFGNCTVGSAGLPWQILFYPLESSLLPLTNAAVAYTFPAPAPLTGYGFPVVLFTQNSPDLTQLSMTFSVINGAAAYCGYFQYVDYTGLPLTLGLDDTVLLEYTEIY
jgi:hypothetical protein